MTESGLEACARALSSSVDAVAVAGGEGSRRLVECVRARGVAVLDGDGADAVRAALGHNLAGGRAAVIVSGESVFSALSVMHEALRAKVGLPWVIASHGAESGRPEPDDEMTDLEWLLGAPVGMLVAREASEVFGVTREACARAHAHAAVWCAGFALSRAGLAEVSAPEATGLGDALRIESDLSASVRRGLWDTQVSAQSVRRATETRR